MAGVVYGNLKKRLAPLNALPEPGKGEVAKAKARAQAMHAQYPHLFPAWPEGGDKLLPQATLPQRIARGAVPKGPKGGAKGRRCPQCRGVNGQHKLQCGYRL